IARSRRAGISVPLFSLRSGRSWGIGEIGDIPAFAGWLRVAGQSVLQLLPLNELAPAETSPYSALSAMAIDPRYLSIADIEDAADFERLWADDIRQARAAPAISYWHVVELKRRALGSCFDRFFEVEWQQRSPRAMALEAFVQQERWWLDEYSL